ncbi:MAG: type II secretion system protein F [Lysobacteraceae bacterium]|nr:MAG: type II secretion system protein F [Xanthomonadaceae bacterium]
MATKAAELNTYIWEGTDKRGTKMKGEQAAKNPTLVKAELRRQGIQPKRVRKKPKALFGGGKKKITPREIAIFSRQLATMMHSGVPLVQSFEIIAGGSDNASMKEMVLGIKSDVEGGATLSEAMSHRPLQFDELYVNLVRAGETAGVLDTLLDTIATYKEKTESIKGKIKKALFYPATVMAVAILVSILLLVWVVPQFESIFKSFGGDLPAFTQMIVDASESVQEHGFFYAIIAGGAIFGLIQLKKRSRKFAHFLDRAILKVPIVGQIMNHAAIARFARTLATTFAAGVPLVDALQTVAGATGNIVYSDAVLKIRDDVATGHQLQLAMRQVDVFPHMVVQMTAIGEESGNLDAMLTKVAEFYEEEVDNAVDALSSLLEPFIMIIIGGIVGSMVIGMYLPIFKLAATI